VGAADLIINVGHDVIEKPPFFMTQGGTQKVIHVNFYAAEVDEVYFPDHEVVGDIANAIWRFKEALQPVRPARPNDSGVGFAKVIETYLRASPLPQLASRARTRTGTLASSSQSARSSPRTSSGSPTAPPSPSSRSAWVPAPVSHARSEAERVDQCWAKSG